MDYYSTKKIDKKNAQYNLIVGERSNGKTYALLKKALKAFFNTGEKFVYLRRWSVDIQAKRMKLLFSSLVANGELKKLTSDYDDITYRAGTFYLCRYDESHKPIYSEYDSIGYAICLSNMEHDKSITYTDVKLIIFDEFLTRGLYLNDEFITFMNVLSTIIRNRTDVKIYMLANTVSTYSPYFKEFGITKKIETMEAGTIDVYKYGNSNLKLAIERTATSKSKKSNVYFAFDNPRLNMIKGGTWELGIYDHLPIKYKPSEIEFTYFIYFNDLIYQCEIINHNNNWFTYIHEKTTPIKNKHDLVYSLDSSISMYTSKNIFKPINKVQNRIVWFFNHDKVFFQSNTVGEGVYNYIRECKKIGR